jgi:hypothetical protein
VSNNFKVKLVRCDNHAYIPAGYMQLKICTSFLTGAHLHLTLAKYCKVWLRWPTSGWFLRLKVCFPHLAPGHMVTDTSGQTVDVKAPSCTQAESLLSFWHTNGFVAIFFFNACLYQCLDFNYALYTNVIKNQTLESFLCLVCKSNSTFPSCILLAVLNWSTLMNDQIFEPLMYIYIQITIIFYACWWNLSDFI